MAILILEEQRRLRQLGEIRLGELKAITKKDGTPGIRPAKLKKFRLTSPDRRLLEGVASLYGGTVQQWTPPNGGAAEWEVYTEVDRLPVIVPPNALSQWYEEYKGPQCVKRCDGVTEQKSDGPCICDPQRLGAKLDPQRRRCATTTRLNVMLRDVEATGTWLLISRGYFAAIELPGMADLISRIGAYAPCTLGLEQRRVTQANGDPADIVVPTLDLALSPGKLLGGGVSAPEAMTANAPPTAIGGQRAALPAAPEPTPQLQAPEVPDYLAQAYEASDAATVGAIWNRAVQAGHMTNDLAAKLKAIGEAFRAAEATPVVEAEVVPDQPAPATPDGDTDALWGEIVRVAGSRTPPWTMPQLLKDFHGWSGMEPADASAEAMRRYLHLLKTGEEQAS